MRVGAPREIKSQEHRVGLSPASVRELVRRGHRVLIERSAGAAVDFSDAAYAVAGADLVERAEAVFEGADLVVKVKEPQAAEREMLREGQLLFAFLHLAADPEQADALLASGATCIAYETVIDRRGRLPLLAPMSEVAGRLSVQVGAHHLEKAQGGRGVLLGGVSGAAAAKILIIGAGIAGEAAARTALGMGADVTVIDRSVARLRQLSGKHASRLRCVRSSAAAIEACAVDSDLVIGAVLIPGSPAPKVLSRDVVRRMRRGAVAVDLAIDQGGCFETSRPTTHEDPVYRVDGVVHYCVTNMPSAVARTATEALNNATLPFVLALADRALDACARDERLLSGVNVHRGQLTCAAVAEALSREWVEPRRALASGRRRAKRYCK